MQRVLGAIDWLRDGYVAIVRRLVRLAVFGVVAVAVCGAAAYGVFRIAPQGFLPSEDQGAFFVAMRLPEGASLKPHRRPGQAGRGHHPADPRGAGRGVGSSA